MPTEPITPTFTFTPRWKEEMVCACALGSFVLEMPMGITIAYLPTPERWASVALDWAVPLYETLREQLAAWCRERNIPLHIDATAAVWTDAC